MPKNKKVTSSSKLRSPTDSSPAIIQPGTPSESELNKDLLFLAKSVLEKENQSGWSDSEFSVNFGTPQKVPGREGRTPHITSTGNLTPSTSTRPAELRHSVAGHSMPASLDDSLQATPNKSKQRFSLGPSEEAVDLQCNVRWKEDAEVWLIQMPADMPEEELSGVTFDVKTGGSLSYDADHPQSSMWEGLNISVKKKSKKFEMSGLTFLLPDDNNRLRSVGQCAGQINVTRNVKVSVNAEPLVHPRQRPCIPAGLKHRAVAFGGDGPAIITKRPAEEQSGPEIDEEPKSKNHKKSKKKKKKHTRET